MIKLFQKLNKRPIFQNVRTLCSVTPSQSHNQKTNFVTVYHFPYIRVFSIINRLKLYQTVVTGISIPSCLALNILNMIHIETFQCISAIGLSGCVTLYGFGFLTIKFIGFIYYDEQRNLVKVAYVDFWGNRKEIEISASDIIPMVKLPASITDGLYIKFKRYSTNEVLKYNLKYGVIVSEKIDKVM